MQREALLGHRDHTVVRRHAAIVEHDVVVAGAAQRGGDALERHHGQFGAGARAVDESETGAARQLGQVQRFARRHRLRLRLAATLHHRAQLDVADAKQLAVLDAHRPGQAALVEKRAVAAAHVAERHAAGAQREPRSAGPTPADRR